MTALLVLVILLMTSDRRTARFTPLVLWPLVAALVWQSAAYTGTSLNPARSLGPALLAPLLTPLPVYLVGPVLGGLLAVGVFSLIKDRRPDSQALPRPALPVRPREQAADAGDRHFRSRRGQGGPEAVVTEGGEAPGES